MAAAASPLPAETTREPACALSDVTKAFGAVKAVDGVSLRCRGRLADVPHRAERRRESRRCSAASRGFHLVDGGVVRIDGQDVTRWPPHRRARHGLATVFQTTRPLAQLDVLDNAAVGSARSLAHRLRREHAPPALAMARGAAGAGGGSRGARDHRAGRARGGPGRRAPAGAASAPRDRAGARTAPLGVPARRAGRRPAGRRERRGSSRRSEDALPPRA